MNRLKRQSSIAAQEVLISSLHTIFLLLISILISSCGSAVYHVDVAGIKETYEESSAVGLDELFADQLGVPVTVISGDPDDMKLKGTGFRLSISESTKYIMSKIGYFKSSFEDYTINLNIDGTPTLITSSLNTSGFDFVFGIRIKYLTPYLMMRKVTMSQTVSLLGTSTKTSASSNLFGYGVSLDIPIMSDKYLLYASYNKVSQTEYFVGSSSYQSLLVGVKIYLGTSQGLQMKSASSSKK